MTRPYIPRKTFKFQLRTDAGVEARLVEYIKYLRDTRQFVTVIRDGLRLMWTLSEGDTSVLAELFPGIVQSLKASTPASPPPDTSNLERKIDQLQQAFLSGGAGSPNSLQMLPATTGGTIGGMTGKSLTGKTFAMPTFDDDDDDQDTVVINKSNEGTSLTENFLERMFAFQAEASKASADAAPLNEPRQTTRRAPRDDNDLLIKKPINRATAQ